MTSNWRGTYALFYREIWRFLRIIVQTLCAPVLTALLYLVVFGHLLENRISLYEEVSYKAFLVPGLIMMSVIQNAFANASSSIMQSKMMGNLVFVLMAPISSFEFFLAFVGAAMLRGVMVAIAIYLAAWLITDIAVAHLGLLLFVTIVCSAMMGALGLIAGLWAEKIEQMAAFQNFVIMPFSFLSGVFYSIKSLPPFWQELSHFNPFFYMIDSFRFAFIGHSDIDPSVALLIISFALLVVSALCIYLLNIGYKIRN